MMSSRELLISWKYDNLRLMTHNINDSNDRMAACYPEVLFSSGHQYLFNKYKFIFEGVFQSKAGHSQRPPTMARLYLGAQWGSGPSSMER